MLCFLLIIYNMKKNPKLLKKDTYVFKCTTSAISRAYV